VQRGEFREDLFFRLAAIEMRVPPLRERQGDIGILAHHFVERLCKQQGIERKMHDAALQELLHYRWPGNVRELEHVVARAFLLAEGELIETFHLPTDPSAPMDSAATGIAPATQATAEWPAISLAEAERRTIEAVMKACAGEKTAAAKMLGISRTALYEKLKRLEPGGDGS
jgi:DNA-binding NtrC family response regulator